MIPWILTFWLLNLADIMLTRHLVAVHGAVEGNPLIDGLMQYSFMLAATAKMAIVSIAVVLFAMYWRRIPWVPSVVVILTISFAALVVYEAILSL